MKKLTCLITGANGFVGSCIAKYLKKHKFVIVELGRKYLFDKKIIKYNLGDEVKKSWFKNIDVFIHCAYDFTCSNWKNCYKINVKSSIDLLECAKADVKRIIFISSVSAFEEAKSNYGRAKYAVEEKVKDFAFLVRPGLVYSDETKSTMGTLISLVKKSPVIPFIKSKNQKIYLCHGEDLARLIYNLAVKKIAIKGPIIAASEKWVTLLQVLKSIAKANNKKRIFLPVPFFLLYFCARLLELLPFRISIRSDSIISLANLNKKIDFSNTKKTKIIFRDF